MCAKCFEKVVNLISEYCLEGFLGRYALFIGLVFLHVSFSLCLPCQIMSSMHKINLNLMKSADESIII